MAGQRTAALESPAGESMRLQRKAYSEPIENESVVVQAQPTLVAAGEMLSSNNDDPDMPSLHTPISRSEFLMASKTAVSRRN